MSKRNRKTAATLSFVLLLVTIAAACVCYRCLPFSTERLSLAVGCFVIGAVFSIVLFATITTMPDKRWLRVAMVSFILLFLCVPLASTVAPRVTYAQFGFTVFGATPIPVLDITVNQHGVLGFRPKTHRITRVELDALVKPGVEVVVIGIGWDSVAQLTDDAKRLGDSIDLRVLPTPEAFALYNQLRAEGRCVALLAHSTC